jgi:hypothetical protein
VYLLNYEVVLPVLLAADQGYLVGVQQNLPWLNQKMNVVKQDATSSLTFTDINGLQNTVSF